MMQQVVEACYDDRRLDLAIGKDVFLAVLGLLLHQVSRVVVVERRGEKGRNVEGKESDKE